MFTFVSNLVSGLVLLIQKLVAAFLGFCITAAQLNSLTPSLNYVKKHLFINGSFDLITELFLKIAAILMIFMFFLHLLQFGLGNLKELKDSIWTLLLRLVFTAVLIISMTSLLDIFFTCFGKIDNLIVLKLGVTGNPAGELADANITGTQFLTGIVFGDFSSTPENIVGVSVSSISNYLGNTLYSEISGILSILGSVVSLILLAIVVYNIVKLMVEVVQKYITLVMLYSASSIFAAFFISAESQDVFFSFLKMFGVSSMMLVLSKMWLTLTIFLLNNVVFSFIGAFSILAFIKLYLSLDGLLSKLGLSTASTGAALLDSVSITAMGMMSTVRMGTSIASAGTGAVAGLTGNAQLMKFSNILGHKGPSDAAAMSGLTDGIFGQMRQNRAMTNPASGANNLSLSQIDTAKRLFGRNDTHSRAALSSAIGSFTPQQKAQLFNELSNSLRMNGNQSFASAIKAGGFSNATIEHFDSSGTLHGKMQSVNGKLFGTFSISNAPKNDKSIGFSDANGNMKYFTPNNDIQKLNVGEQVKFADVLALDDKGNMDISHVPGLDTPSLLLGRDICEIADQINKSQRDSNLAELSFGDMVLEGSDNGTYIKDNEGHILAEVLDDGDLLTQHPVFSAESKEEALSMLNDMLSKGQYDDELKGMINVGELSDIGIAGIHQASEVQWDKESGTMNFVAKMDDGELRDIRIQNPLTNPLGIEHGQMRASTYQTDAGALCVQSRPTSPKEQAERLQEARSADGTMVTASDIDQAIDAFNEISGQAKLLQEARSADGTMVTASDIRQVNDAFNEISGRQGVSLSPSNHPSNLSHSIDVNRNSFGHDSAVQRTEVHTETHSNTVNNVSKANTSPNNVPLNNDTKVSSDKKGYINKPEDRKSSLNKPENGNTTSKTDKKVSKKK